MMMSGGRGNQPGRDNGKKKEEEGREGKDKGRKKTCFESSVLKMLIPS